MALHILENFNININYKRNEKIYYFGSRYSYYVHFLFK